MKTRRMAVILAMLLALAATAGVFKIICATHQPSMTAELVVLPRN